MSADGEDGREFEELKWQMIRPTAEPEFLSNPGINPNLRQPGPANGQEERFLRLFVTDEILDSIKNWTNSKAEKTIAEG
jgi:hypothetical protein